MIKLINDDCSMDVLNQTEFIHHYETTYQDVFIMMTKRVGLYLIIKKWNLLILFYSSQ